ncbi:hypothetical protein [Oceanivirga miroungae]|uniref:Uncharacterized protein n=1 Tax=Oceanivirga miroungae TaxID=1130046 RepID=A0A6I8MAW1_9FUSO|nr:hypothetical protein [Oceanivirga miroungae]VWL85323.1 hypothetical protein OMES3154_00607 [Oceanivirga miroungae]
MSNISYLYQLYNKNISKIIINEFHPYLQCYVEKDRAYINLNEKIENTDLIDKYIRLCINYEYILNTNRLNILARNKKYVFEKYKLKLKYNKDYIYIFIKVLNSVFSSNIVYYNKSNNLFIIYLDYEKSQDNIDLINEILNNFMPINYNYVYTFSHIYTLDIKEIGELERWFLL